MAVEEISAPAVEFTDYPISKFGKKVDFWTSSAGMQLIVGWRQNGLSIQQIAGRAGVDIRTFRGWRKKCPELDNVLTVGQDIANAKAVTSLFKRVTGFYYDEITKELVAGELRITKVVTKYVPPDTKACLAWLFNRYPDQWRAVQDPLDVYTPELLAANNVLVTIREATEGHGTASGGSEGQKAVQESEAKGSASEAFGGVR